MSSFTWLDFAESDRQRTLDVIDLFREKGTVDELGLGTVRDAVADLLFPGTSTIMTRARYYLFIPWIYLRHESRKTPSSEISQKSRRDEIRLIEALRNGGESRGVIGIEAGPTLKRLPSTIYWQALGVLGIRRYQGSRDSYHRSLDAYYAKGDVIRGDDGHVISGGNLRRWDPSLPNAPAGFLTESSLRLTEEEANYLRERLMYAAPHSLFAFLANQPLQRAEIVLPWEHPLAEDFPPVNQVEVMHARNFSELMHGAAVLYNLLLARQRSDEEGRQAYYDDLFHKWSNLVEIRKQILRKWSRDDFWTMLHGTGARIPAPTQTFATIWMDLVLAGSAARLKESTNAHAIITKREEMLKGSLARLRNPRARDLWGGASSSDQLSYRWNRPVKTLLSDIREALDS
jgi:hypothetical protein